LASAGFADRQLRFDRPLAGDVAQGNTAAFLGQYFGDGRVAQRVFDHFHGLVEPAVQRAEIDM
jgi:hypothetical protein